MAKKIILAQLALDEKAFLAAAKNTQKAILELAKTQKLLKKNGKENSEQFIKNEIALKKLRGEYLQQKKAIIALESPYQKLSNRLIRARKEFKDLAATQGISNKRLTEARTKVLALDRQLKRIDKSVGQHQRSVGNYAGALKGLTASFLGITAVIFGVIRGFRQAIGIFTTFEKKNAELSAILQIEKGQMSDLEAESKRLGATTAKTATEIVGLQIAFARLGFTQKQIIELTEATISGSIAMNSELDKTAELVGAMVNSFDDFDAVDAPEIIDVLALSTAKSALNFEKLEKGLPIVAGAANAAGIPFNTLVSLMGKLADAGIDVSTSSTAIRNIFIEAAGKGEDYNQIIERIKNSQDKLTASFDAFGKRAAVSAAVIAQNIDATKELNIQLDNATGTAQRMAKKGLDTLSGSGTLFSSAWQGLILGLEDGQGVFAKSLRGIVDFGTSLLNALTPAEDLSTAFFNLQSDINNLESDITPLLDRYDDLEEKTELSKDEQIELRTIINKIAEDIPSAVTEFDKYGVALGIVTDAARDFIGEQKNILKLKNKEAIEDEEKAIESLTSKFNSHALSLEKQEGKFIKIERIYTKLGNEIQTAVELTDKEILTRNKSRAAITLEIETRQAIISQLKGEVTEKEKLTEAERKAAEAAKAAAEAAAKKVELTAEELKKRREKAKRDLIKFEQDKIDLLNEIEIAKLETDKEKEELKSKQKRDKEILEVEELLISDAQKTELIELLKTAHLERLTDIQQEHDIKTAKEKEKNDKVQAQAQEKFNKEELKRQETFNKQTIRAERVLQNAKNTVISAGVNVLKSILGDSVLFRLAALFFRAKSEVAQVQIASDSAQLQNYANALKVPPPFTLAAIGKAFAQNVVLALAAKATQAKIITATAIGGIGAIAGGFYEGGRVPTETGGRISGQNIPTRRGGDNIVATVKSGEVILNDQQQQRAGGDAFFKSIGVPGFQDGGIAGIPSTTLPTQSILNTEEFAEILAERINDIKIVAIEEEISEAIATKVEIVDGANI